MKLIKLNQNKVQLGKEYLHGSGRRFLAFHFVVNNDGEKEVELLEKLPETSKKHYMKVSDFESRLLSGVLVKAD